MKSASEKLRPRSGDLPPPAVPAAAEPDHDLRKALEQLAQTYNNLAAAYGSHLPDLDVEHDGVRRPVADVVQEEVILRVFAWQEWHRLLQLAERGRIRLGQTAKVLPGRTKTPPACRTDDFYPVFESQLRQLEQFARDALRRAVPDLLQQLADRVLEPRQSLQTALDAPGAEEPFRRSIGEEGLVVLEVLRIAVDPRRLRENILAGCELDGDRPPQLDPNRLFPLARKDALHPIGRIFAWDPSNTHNAPGADHQIQVLRLRNEFAVHLAQTLGQLVAQKNRQILADVLLPTFRDLALQINEVLLNADLVRGLAGGARAGDGGGRTAPASERTPSEP